MQKYHIGVILTKKNMTELTLYDIIIYQEHALRRLHFANTPFSTTSNTPKLLQFTSVLAFQVCL